MVCAAALAMCRHDADGNPLAPAADDGAAGCKDEGQPAQPATWDGLPKHHVAQFEEVTNNRQLHVLLSMPGYHMHLHVALNGS